MGPDSATRNRIMASFPLPHLRAKVASYLETIAETEYPEEEEVAVVVVLVVAAAAVVVAED